MARIYRVTLKTVKSELEPEALIKYCLILLAMISPLENISLFHLKTRGEGSESVREARLGVYTLVQ